MSSLIPAIVAALMQLFIWQAHQPAFARSSQQMTTPSSLAADISSTAFYCSSVACARPEREFVRKLGQRIIEQRKLNGPRISQADVQDNQKGLTCSERHHVKKELFAELCSDIFSTLTTESSCESKCSNQSNSSDQSSCRESCSDCQELLEAIARTATCTGN